MAATKTVGYLSGKLYWAKVFGPPRMNYQGDAKEWAFEFEPDTEATAFLKQHKLADRLKTKDDRKPYLNLRQKELRPDGSPNEPIRVYDSNNQPWDPKVLLGNGTTAVVKLDIKDYGPGKKKGVYPVAIQVHDLVEYQQTDFPQTAPSKGDVAEDFAD